ncbi:hypothetical protein [Variovorax sp. EBFNA2]|uniref:hypothetical protein n=1 Tax=Variovorax sp. EBFNA2 TaxID=3342097 RepID=UPI0029C0B6E5|nr:hypothetical protein [Variovorax boronicumulans]WPG38265.1 hypothetical protein RZE79_02725 [Variovorax boronicumulans]
MAQPRKDTKDADKDTAGGDTRVEKDGESAPRLPHERDQSSDSQAMQDGQPPEKGRRGYEDVERGVVDTDRGLTPERTPDGKVRP